MPPNLFRTLTTEQKTTVLTEGKNLNAKFKILNEEK
jgi:hypothetical protein